MSQPRRYSAALAPLAALLFGASPPLCKILLGGASPLVAASLLYLGSGAGLLALVAVRRAVRGGPASPPLRGRDWLLLLGAVASGAVLAPLLLLAGLLLAPASVSSLLLNLELVFTAVLAWWFFREGFERRVALGMAGIVLGCAVLSWPGRLETGGGLGALAVAAACLLWGLDNNLTQALSERDPVQVAALKSLAGGAVNGVAAFAVGSSFPLAWTAPALLLVGFVCYGVSLLLFIASLRRVGTARTAAGFALAPFVGAGLSFALLAEPVSPRFFAGLACVGAGLWLALAGRHEHTHTHEALAHDHLHVHDEHHRHEHPDGATPAGPHSHPHVHEPLTHPHAHFPDIHHRHGHGPDR